MGRKLKKSESRPIGSDITDRSRSAENNRRARQRQSAIIALCGFMAIAVITLATVLKGGFGDILGSSADTDDSIADVAETVDEVNADAAAETSEFAECNIPEINMLAEDYFTARLAADTTRIFEIFGRSNTSEDTALADKLKAQADWIQSYKVTGVYAAAGLDDNSRMCIVLYDIDFRRTDTLAPGVMYFYAVRGSDGAYTITENPVKEVYDYIQSELETESAKQLIDDSNARLKEALDTDSTLALIYDSFRSGEIYKESELDVDGEQDVKLFTDPADSVLVGDDVLSNIQNEAAEEAAIEASLAAEDEASTASEQDAAGTETSAETGGEDSVSDNAADEGEQSVSISIEQ